MEQFQWPVCKKMGRQPGSNVLTYDVDSGVLCVKCLITPEHWTIFHNGGHDSAAGQQTLDQWI